MARASAQWARSQRARLWWHESLVPSRTKEHLTVMAWKHAEVQRRLRTVVFLVLFLPVAACAGPLGSVGDAQPGRVRVDELVRAYVEAARDGDAAAVRPLYDGEHVSILAHERAVHEALIRYAGQGATSFRVLLIPSEVVGNLCSAEVWTWGPETRNRAFRERVEMSLALDGRDESRWALVPGVAALGSELGLDEASDAGPHADEGCGNGYIGVPSRSDPHG